MKSFVLLAALCVGPLALADIATFDDLTEGGPHDSVTDGGITFSGLFVDQPEGSTVFTIEDASDVFTGSEGYSSPNVLGFGGYSPGGGVGFAPWTSFWITPSSLADSISLDLFFSRFDNEDKSVSLELYRDGTMVDSTTITLISDPSSLWFHQSLSRSGLEFDAARVVGSGPVDNLMFGVVDNVEVNAVPEPATLAALALGSGFLLKRRRR